MSEPIDFSTREDEFLSRDLKQKVASWAIISSILGFVFSAVIFVGRGVGSAHDVLNRQEAEGTSVFTRSRKSLSGHVSYRGFRPPKMKKLEKLEKREKPAWTKIAKTQKQKAKKVAPKAKVKERKNRVVEAEVSLVPAYTSAKTPKKRPRRIASRPRKPKKSPGLDQDRLIFPKLDNRADEMSFLRVEAMVKKNLLTLKDRRGNYLLGLGLDSEGRAVVPNHPDLRNFLGSVRFQGETAQAEILGKDADFGLCLIKIPGARFEEIVLAPAPPLRSEEVLSFTNSQRAFHPFQGRAGVSFGRAGVYLDGIFDADRFGGPVFNARGELVACHVGNLPGLGRSQFHLGADASVIYRLIRGYRNEKGNTAKLEDSAIRRLVSFLESGADSGKKKRGRVLPGLAMSDFYLGMPSSEAQSKVSAPKKTRLGGGVELWTVPAPPLSLYFVRERLAMASTKHNGYSTERGLSVGADVDVKRLSKDHPDIRVSRSLVSLSGLDLWMSANRVTEFVVKPELFKP